MTGYGLIVGAGAGISASVAAAFAREGMRLGLAARDTDKLAGLARETDALTFQCDASDPKAVEAMFAQTDKAFESLDFVLFNPSRRFSGPLAELDRDGVREALMTGAYGGFLVAQAAAKRMVKQGSGAIFFTGASASVKGYAKSAPFAMAKFALRGLAQSMARELHPQNIHIAHFVIDGGVANPAGGRINTPEKPDVWLEPDAIAQTYLDVYRQPRSAWAWEVELRPWVETF